MTTDQAIRHYGTQQKLAAALGIKQGSVSGWGEFPPAIRQLQLQQLTRDKLRAEPGLLSVKSKVA